MSNHSNPSQKLMINSLAVNSNQISSSTQNLSGSSYENGAKVKNSPSKTNQLRERVNSLQNSTAKAAFRVVNRPKLDQEPGIVDGYLENVTKKYSKFSCFISKN